MRDGGDSEEVGVGGGINVNQRARRRSDGMK